MKTLETANLEWITKTFKWWRQNF